jgi:(R,R)-butanediol dehydrogenase/meso-butanediol dehydrogenase/diacetyl reductase
VLVTGAGPIGILVAMAARAAGASRIFLSDLNDTRLSLARDALGDIRTINPKTERVGDVIRAETEGGVGCDVAIECVGNEHALKNCADAVRKQGVVVQTGLHPGENPLNWFDVTFKDIDIRGSWAYPTHYWPRVARLIASGQIPASRIVTKYVSLSEAVEEGFDQLLDPAGKHLKILIDLSR